MAREIERYETYQQEQDQLHEEIMRKCYSRSWKEIVHVTENDKYIYYGENR